MGNYNPHAPIILGEEWVPVRGETLQLPANSAPFEAGHRFTLAQSRTLTDARFYVDSLPGNAGATPQMMYVYPAGAEDQTGPVESVIIPVNNAVVTGADISAFGSSSYAEALGNPDDSKYARFLYNSAHPIGQFLTVFFATNQYAQQLNGKRILGVNVLYAGLGIIASSEIPSNAVIPISIGNLLTSQFLTIGQLTAIPFYPTGSVVQTASPVSRFGMGDFTELNTTSMTTSADGPVLPWRYADLQRFEITNASPIGVTLTFGQAVAADLVNIRYLALEVVYCAEQRVAVGGKYSGQAAGGYNVGANVVPLFTPAGAANPVLVAGDYTVVVTNGDTGSRNDAAVDFANVPPINALRELYAISPHRGIQIDRTGIVGQQFTLEQVHVLPQLSIHVSGGTLTEPHVYGDMDGAPVYGSVTASQVIYDDVVPVPASFPQVRFYARRFGDTTVPLTLSTSGPTISGSSVFISPTDLDALDEIVDGWREVTLRFPTAPTMGGLTPDPTWTWSATGELAGNRWEVLLASAPAMSGTPGNLLNTVRATDLLNGATYQPTAGAATALTWLYPAVSGATLDATSDAVLLFSQDPPTITGVSVSVQSLALTGFTECGTGPCCVPTALQYHQLDWSTPLPIQADRFQRDSTDSLGGSWSVGVTGGGSISNVDVGAATGATIVGAGTYTATLPQSYTDVDEQADLTLPTVGLGSYTADLLAREQDASNYYALRLASSGSLGQLTLQLVKVVAGAVTTLSSALVLPFIYGTGTRVTLRLQIVGTTLRGRAWLYGTDEPDEWQVSSWGDAAFSSGLSGFRYSTGTAGVNLGLTRFLALPAGMRRSTMELQRQDDETDWQTIMSSSLADVLRFNDYEARVGVSSRYRVRVVNERDFAGSWSSTATSTIPDPGVTLPSCGTGRRGVLIFTSNYGQSGQYALAYPPTWEGGDVSEDHSFPEAGDVALSQQYGRDFAVAFHGTERGGETFSRVLLLGNAAIAVPRLADTRSLRDLAWADLPYVCVRDDLGDRWLAAVLVAGNTVRRSRRLYNAQITVVETTDTAAPVAP